MRFLAVLFLALLSPVLAFAGPVEEGKATVSPVDVQISPECKNVPLSDPEFLTSLAEQGNPVAQYELGKLYTTYMIMDRHRSFGDRYSNGQKVQKNDDEAVKWWTKSAESGYVMGQYGLCIHYDNLSAQRNSKPEYEAAAAKWCLKAAEQGHPNATDLTAAFYYNGQGPVMLPDLKMQNFEEAYFWHSLQRASGPMVAAIATHLKPEQKIALDKRIKEWKPVITGPGDKIPLFNVAGLICGGHSKGCELTDTCGDLVGIACPSERPEYFLASKHTAKFVSVCPDKDNSCKDFVPKEWTCPSPKNMPLSSEEADRYAKYGKDIVSCGDVLGVDINSGGDGPYFFVNKITGEKTGSCNFWKGKCNPPLGWSCGRPSNYRG
jgi:hypothetical protein